MLKTTRPGTNSLPFWATSKTYTHYKGTKYLLPLATAAVMELVQVQWTDVDEAGWGLFLGAGK